jgi:MFS family permease
MRDYWRVARRAPELVAFGAALALFSSFGQTFLVSLFVPALQVEFGFSEARFGVLYSLATLASGLLLPLAGRGIDRWPLHWVTAGVIGLMAVSALLLAGAWQLWVLGLALVGVRLAGQGLSGHTSLTAMARYFPRVRGKALSLASLGFPAGEATLPLATTALIGALGWRSTWLVIAGTSLVVFLPLSLGLLRRSGAELDPGRLAEAEARADLEAQDAVATSPAPTSEGQGEASRAQPVRSWSRREVLRDVRFQMALPAALLPPFWATGLILYQAAIARERGWSLTLMATAFVAYALARVLSSLLVGGAIDRVTARRLFPWACLPMGVGVAFLAWGPGVWPAFAFMGCLGLTVGLSGTLKSALWAELYGARHLGAIKGLMGSFMVFSTAAAPALVGFVLARDGGLQLLLIGAMASVVVATVLACAVWRPPARARPIGRERSGK